MSFMKLLSNTAACNAWANQSLVQWLSTKPVEELSQEVPSSYSSLLKTLNHIWAVEEFWLGAISETATSPTGRYLATTFDAAEILPGLVAQSRALEAYVAGLSAADYDKVITLDLPWVKGALPRYELLQHVFNHSTYHRGQLTSIGRRLGYTDAPMTDYNFYNMVVLAPVA